MAVRPLQPGNDLGMRLVDHATDISSGGGYARRMETHRHHSHPGIVKRLKRAHGHLAKVITMIEADEPCVELAQQLLAVESAIINAKRELIQDHMEHCLGDGVGEGEMSSAQAMAEFKVLAKYL